MNTTFKILWFEDEPVWFNMEKLRIEGILKTHYLIPVIERRDGDDFDLEELTGNDYDLIFMDYKLAERKTGDTIVAAISSSSSKESIISSNSSKCLRAYEGDAVIIVQKNSSLPGNSTRVK